MTFIRDKRALTTGAVKPWHVVFMSFVAWSVGIVGGYKVTQGVDTQFRAQLWEIAMWVIYSAIVLAFVVVVPEFRRSLKTLFTKSQVEVERWDVALAFGVLLTWGYGVYRTVVCLPILITHPATFRTLRFTEAMLPFEPKYLLALVGSVIVAPVAEELIFRGYLVNLLLVRRGTTFAVLASSFLFAIFHLETAAFGFVCGIVFALIYLRFDSLWPGIIVHGAYNLLAFPWLVGGLFYVRSADALTNVSGWIPEIVISLAFIPLAIGFWRRFKPSRTT